MNRFLEIFIAVALLILTAPVQFLTGCAVFVKLGRPVFFIQQRSGLRGAPIFVLKFRTMTDARDGAGDLLPDAQRLTRVTALIRRLRLDELPQLWLILGGRMALVGPRPLLPETLARFGAGGVLRGQVRPGVTGWAQVSGNTHLNGGEKLALDLWYVCHRDIWLDLRILAETAKVALRGETRNAVRLAAARAWLKREAQAATPAGPRQEDCA
ncbi:MAG: sugar transferase [Celeribacter sp.]